MCEWLTSSPNIQTALWLVYGSEVAPLLNLDFYVTRAPLTDRLWRWGVRVSVDPAMVSEEEVWERNADARKGH